MHWSWTLSRKNSKRFCDITWDLRWVMDHDTKSGDWPCNCTQIRSFMQTPPAFTEGATVIRTRYNQHRNRIGKGLANTRSGIGYARTRDNRTDPRFAGHPCITVGHKACTLLIAWGDRLYATLFYAAIQFQCVFAGNSKNRVYTVGSQKMH